MLEPTQLVQYADVVTAKLEDSDAAVCACTMHVLGMLEPTKLVQHANAVVDQLNDPEQRVRHEALAIVEALPLAITSDLNWEYDVLFEAGFEPNDLRSRLLGP